MPRILTPEQKERKNLLARANRIKSKMEKTDYIPDPEEKKLLIEAGFEEPKEPEMISYVDSLNADQGEMMESEIEEPKEEIEEARPIIVIDGEVTEIIGTIDDIDVGEEMRNGILTIKDGIGDLHNVEVHSKGTLWSLFYHSDSKTYLNGLTYLNEIEDIQEEVQRISEIGKKLVFRIIKDEGVNVLFATVSLKYKKSKIENLIPIIKDCCPSGEMQVSASTGRWGGSALVKFDEGEVSQFNIHINGGILDGKHSITINVGGMILACANEMVMDVQKIIGDMLPNFSFGVRSVHSGDSEAFKEKLLIAISEIEKFQSTIEEAKDITISKEEQTSILAFYVRQGVISEKTIKTLTQTILDDDSIQQVPGTLWGLAMVLTYAGTHCDFVDGVKYALKKTGGELLCVSRVFDKYMKLVNDIPE